MRLPKEKIVIIMESNQHEIKCLKWKFYHKSLKRSTFIWDKRFRLCVCVCWTECVQLIVKNSILYSVRCANIDWLIWYSCSKQAMMVVARSPTHCTGDRHLCWTSLEKQSHANAHETNIKRCNSNRNIAVIDNWSGMVTWRSVSSSVMWNGCGSALTQTRIHISIYTHNNNSASRYMIIFTIIAT